LILEPRQTPNATAPNPPVDTRAGLDELARALRSSPRVALDVESDGMFAYRARVCAVQLAAQGRIAIVDALATRLDALGPLLGDDGPVKIVHDVAFDARMLASSGIRVGNVHDTSIAARLLGRTATGLATLARAELGVEIDKTLQHHDWRERPLLETHLDYLARDVAHLEALEEILWRELAAHGIEAEVLEETRYRVENAVAAAQEVEHPLAYADAKGFDRLSPLDRAVFRRLFSAREALAEELDMPAARAVATDALIAIARARPMTLAALSKVQLPRERLPKLAPPFLDAVRLGIEDGDLPPEDRAKLDVPRPSRELVLRRRARESALTSWRKAEAKRRSVDEQVVLPGHCLKALAEEDAIGLEAIGAVPGLGACRARYVEEIASALRGAGPAETRSETG
jgi:ribonuclease D